MDAWGVLKRRPEMNLAPFVWTGLQIVHPRLFDGAPQGRFSINKLWDKALDKGRLYGVRLDGTWIHVGTPQGLEEAERFLKRSRPRTLMEAARPQVFTIPSGFAFARALAAGVIARSGADPLLLADALVLVPTRRAARALREAFADALGGAALLPNIRALGDVDEDESSFDPTTDDIEAVPPVAPLRRRLLLAQLVERWGVAKHAPVPFTQALNYAGELANFLDEAVTQGADLTKLDTLAPDAMAAHWNEVVKFLAIVAEQWPGLLKAEGASEPAAHRDAKLRSLAARLAANPPRAPVIAAGSTGSIPATAELLKTIASLPTGAVVLPGLDRDLDAASWEKIEPAHAQFGLRQLLAYIGVEREDVALWSPLPDSYPARAQRVRFLSEALRPPPTTDAWRDLVEAPGNDLAPGLENFSLVEAQHPRAEALAVACALREALETKGRTAALVTQDRLLARRVAAEMTRWNIAIDDSAGMRLSRTPPGAFLALLARAAATRFAPVALLALLKHPLASGGEERSHFRRNVRALEMAALRGLRPEPGLTASPNGSRRRTRRPHFKPGSPSSPVCSNPSPMRWTQRRPPSAISPAHMARRPRRSPLRTPTPAQLRSGAGPQAKRRRTLSPNWSATATASRLLRPATMPMRLPNSLRRARCGPASICIRALPFSDHWRRGFSISTSSFFPA